MPAIVVVALAIAGCSYNPGAALAHVHLAGHGVQRPGPASLLSRLPLTLTFRDHGGQEKPSQLHNPAGPRRRTGGKWRRAALIGYYAPDQSLVLYYRQVGYFNGIVPSGT